MKSQFLLLILFVSTLSFAQVRVGLLGGANLMTQKFSPPVKEEKVLYIPVWHAGLLVSYPITEQFFIQAGVNYQLKGYKAEGRFSEPRTIKAKGTTLGYEVSGDYTKSANFQYVELPLTFAYAFGSESFKISPYAGGYVSYATSAKITTTATNLKPSGYAVPANYPLPAEANTQDLIFKEDKDENVLTARRWDYGARAGVALEFSNIFISLQYSLGLADVYRVPEQMTTNTGFGLSIGFWINGGSSSNNDGGYNNSSGGGVSRPSNFDSHKSGKPKKYPVHHRYPSKYSK